MQYRLRLVDVIVAVIAIGVVVALLLPAVQSPRTPARRSLCAMYLAELVKASQQFEMTHGRYPGYLEAFGIDTQGRCKVGSWAVTLLPYLEQEPVYELWQDPSTTEAWMNSGGFSAASAKLHFYPRLNYHSCPSDPLNGEKFAPNSYACNAGLFPDPLPPSYSQFSIHEIAQHSTAPQNGVFSNQLPASVRTYYTHGELLSTLGSRAGQPTSSRNIGDGLTATIAFSENLQADSWGYVGDPEGWQTVKVGDVTYAGDDLHPNKSPRVHSGIVWLFRAQPWIAAVEPAQATNRINGNRYTIEVPNKDSARPSSGHTGLVNVAMLGGSVTTISEDIDYVVYQSLMTPRSANSDMPNPKYVLKEIDYGQ